MRAKPAWSPCWGWVNKICKSRDQAWGPKNRAEIKFLQSWHDNINGMNFMFSDFKSIQINLNWIKSTLKYLQLLQPYPNIKYQLLPSDSIETFSSISWHCILTVVMVSSRLKTQVNLSKIRQWECKKFSQSQKRHWLQDTENTGKFQAKDRVCFTMFISS